MRNAITFFTVLLVGWIAGCSYYYVCKVRMNCGAENTEMMQATIRMDSLTPDTLKATMTETVVSLPPDYTLLFNTGLSACEISGSDKNQFTLIKQYIDGTPSGKVVVTGHCDSRGSEAINMKISTQRAEFVKMQLLDAGVPAIER